MFTLNPAGQRKTDHRVRIYPWRDHGTKVDDEKASVLASLCFRTLEQDELQQYILDQRQSLNQILEVLEVPPGLPVRTAIIFTYIRKGRFTRSLPW